MPADAPAAQNLAPQPAAQPANAVMNGMNGDADLINLLDLPDEVLANIAVFLPIRCAINIRLVCRRFRDIVPRMLPLRPQLYLHDPDQQPVSPEVFCLLDALGLLWSRLGAIKMVVGLGTRLTPQRAEAAGLALEHLRSVEVNLLDVTGNDLEDLMATLTSPGCGVNSLSCTAAFPYPSTFSFVPDVLAPALRDNQWGNIASLTLENIDLAQSSAAVAEALRANTTITRLHLEDVELPPESVTAIAAALESNATLADLSIVASELHQGGADAIARLVRRSHTLRRLCLSGNGLGVAALAALAEALQANSSITRLDLSESPDTVEDFDNIFNEPHPADLPAAAAFGRLFADNKTLRVVSLSCSRGRLFRHPNGVVELARGLQKNRTLQRLDLSFCGLDDLGATIIGKVLRDNKTLDEVRLIRSYVSDKVRRMLSQVHGSRLVWE